MPVTDELLRSLRSVVSDGDTPPVKGKIEPSPDEFRRSLPGQTVSADERDAPDDLKALPEDATKRAGLPPLSWPASDEDAPDYAHLAPGGREPKVGDAEFDIGADDLDLLIRANRFDPTGYDDRIVFGLRGAELVGRDTAEIVDRIRLKEVRPDHRNFRCTIGYYSRKTRKISAFKASTVPNAKYMTNYYMLANGMDAQSQTKANLLPTGCYVYRVGAHGGGSINPALRLTDPERLAEDGTVTVLRTKNDLTFKTDDFWDNCQPLDNIHCAYSFDSFSSAGCQTICGPDEEGPWGRFQSVLRGLRANTRMDYVLLTGREASIAAYLRGQGRTGDAELVDRYLGRLRHGSMGDAVKRLQKRLGTAETGYFGAKTKQTLAEHQRKSNARSDGIYSAALDQRFGWDVLSPAPAAAPAPAAPSPAVAGAPAAPVAASAVNPPSSGLAAATAAATAAAAGSAVKPDPTPAAAPAPPASPPTTAAPKPATAPVGAGTVAPALVTGGAAKPLSPKPAGAAPAPKPAAPQVAGAASGVAAPAPAPAPVAAPAPVSAQPPVVAPPPAAAPAAAAAPKRIVQPAAAQSPAPLAPAPPPPGAGQPKPTVPAAPSAPPAQMAPPPSVLAQPVPVPVVTGSAGSRLAFTPETLRRFAPNALDPYLKSLIAGNEMLTRYGINQTPERFCQFLGQIGNECGLLRILEESMTYTSAARLQAVWPSRFPTAASAEPFVRNPEGLAEKVYGGRLGNDQPGDGFRYRGRGLVQITGRGSYREMGRKLGIPLEEKPELACHPEHALKIACETWAAKQLAGERDMNRLADVNKLEAITYRINGGYTNLDDRRASFEKAWSIWGSGEPPRRVLEPDVLDRGDRNDRVDDLNDRLEGLGLFEGITESPPQHVYNASTYRAVRKFQQSNGLAQTGVVAADTWTALERAAESRTRAPSRAPTREAEAPAADRTLERIRQRIRVIRNWAIFLALAALAFAALYLAADLSPDARFREASLWLPYVFAALVLLGSLVTWSWSRAIERTDIERPLAGSRAATRSASQPPPPRTATTRRGGEEEPIRQGINVEGLTP